MYVLARVKVRRSTSKTRDANDRESGKRPDEGAFVEVGENVVHESVDGEGDKVVGDVDQELVPAQRYVVLAGMLDLGYKVLVYRECWTYRVHQGDNSEDKITTQQATGGHEGHPARAVHPTGDPGQNRHPSFPGDCTVLALISELVTPKVCTY